MKAINIITMIVFSIAATLGVVAFALHFINKNPDVENSEMYSMGPIYSMSEVKNANKRCTVSQLESGCIDMPYGCGAYNDSGNPMLCQ